MSQPTILYIITLPDRGGAQSHVLDLLLGFREQFNVQLAVGSEGPLTASARAANIPVHLLPSLRRSISMLSDVQAVAECRKLIGMVRPDLIHAHSSKAGIVARSAGRSTGTPTIFTAHGWAFTPGTPMLRRLLALVSERIAAPLAAQLICVSEFDRQVALRYKVGRPTQLVTIRYGIPNIPVREANPAADPPRLVQVARFNEQKDQPTLLRALAALGRRELTLDLIGSGPSLAQTQTMAASLGITETVRFLGDRDDVLKQLADYQVFILSTHYEGLPISILEAMRTGLPVIASAVSGIPEEIADGVNGLLVPRQDVGALASAIEAMLQSPARRTAMGAASRQRFLAEFTLQRMLDQTAAAYLRALKSPPPIQIGSPG